MSDSATPKPIFMTRFIRIIPVTFLAIAAYLTGKANIVAKSEITKWPGKRDAAKVVIDGAIAFVICSKAMGQRPNWPPGGTMMTRFLGKIFLMAAVATGLATSAFAQAAAPTPWELKSDMGYGYGKDG